MSSPLRLRNMAAALLGCVASLGLSLPLSAADDAPSVRRVPLDSYLSEGSDWQLTKAKESIAASAEAIAKGAKPSKKSTGPEGLLVVVPDMPEPGSFSQKLSADFTKGGTLVGMVKNLSSLDVKDIRSFHMRIKTSQVRELSLRVIDSTGQTLVKQGGYRLKPDGEWHDYEFKTSDIKGTFWGGANDGQWHGPGTELMLYFTKRSDPDTQTPEIFLADISAEALVAGSTDASSAVSYGEGFESSPKLPSGWECHGDTAIVADDAFQGRQSIRLARTKETFDMDTDARGQSIAVSPGSFEVSGAFKADLYSPDVSFNAAVLLLCTDGSGRIVESIRVGEYSGSTTWSPLKKEIVIPAGTTSARFFIVLNKAHGRFWADQLGLSSSAISSTAKSPIRRLVIKTSTVGNLLLPGDKPVFDFTVETTVPLSPEHRVLNYAVSDYWGAEQAAPATIALKADGTAKGSFIYSASLDLSALIVETGKYYEVHATVDAGQGDPVREHSSFAILPEAATKKYPWRDIPFSTRNWDNRIPAYFTLSDRLGIRLMGVWGSWAAQAPYNPKAPGIDACRKDDAGVLTRTPLVDIEHHKTGYEAYTDESLKEGLREFISTYGKDDRLMFVLGNEPQTTGDTVAHNVSLYKLMYEEIKKLSPDSFVVSTSVGPSEEYFKLGFQNACDAVDFHTYEDAKVMESAFDKYDALFAKYGGRKPIWCTESGLNGQGLPRRAIAGDLIRKFCTFFARGGQNISWFAICYPDRTGKLRGASDDSFNIFDGLYGNYSPRLDAIAYYNMINAICVKKFVARKTYADDVGACLFRDKDGHVLQVLYGSGAGREIYVPLPSVSSVRMMRIDGTSETMNAAGHGLLLRVGEDPILLLYDGPATPLPDTLGEPSALLVSLPEKVTRGETVKLRLAMKADPSAKLAVKTPPFWNTTVAPFSEGGQSGKEITLTAPAETETRYVPVTLSLTGSAEGDGDITVQIPVQGQISASLLPVPIVNDEPPGLELTVRNNNPTPATCEWKVSLQREIPVQNGRYSLEVTRPPEAYFAVPGQGRCELPGNGSTRIRLPISKTDPLHDYKVASVVTDSLGRTVTCERFIGGFVGVPKTTAPLKLDGSLDEADWARSRPVRLDEERQFRSLLPKDPKKWTGTADLSGEIRCLWDADNLYLAVKVTDDIFRNNEANSRIWAGDGIQLLIDPARQSADKGGKYDYGFALTNNGPQAWCFLSGDTHVQSGAAKDIRIGVHKAADGTGSVTYEIAIPWSRLQPFRPSEGANLGLALALNEDDGSGRGSFMAWFGDIQSKEVSPVGDLILQP